MPNLWDWLLGGQQAPQFPQGQQQPPAPFNPQQMAIAPTFAQAPQMAQDVAAGVAQPLLSAGNYLGGIMQGSQQFSWPETIQHGAALAMAMAPGPKGERVAGAVERGLAGAAAEAAPTGIRAFHGSPYDFNQFDLSKIGTGEGAQAYGHGLYFAEAEPTAQAYKHSTTDLRDWPIKGENPDWRVPSWVGKTANASPGGLDAMIADFTQRAAQLKAENHWNAGGIKDIVDALTAVKAGKAELQKPGKMYEVNIKAQPEQFLDWDKKVRDMPPEMQQLLIDKGLAAPHGGDIGSQIYNRRADELGHAAATQQFQEAGIPGIRYLDQGSRGAGEGTHNYVVFNDQLIDILKKYGLIGMLGGSTAAPYFAPQQKQQ